jgi:hypothetical protein
MTRLKLESQSNKLLLTRKQAAERLGGISVSTIVRLEQEGRLQPVRLTPRSGQVFYRATDLEMLVEESAEPAAAE